MSHPSTARGNLLSSLPEADEEVFETLVEHPGVVVERIVSRGQASPPGFWYDQPSHEWVLVVSGRARLEIAGEDEAIELGPGQWVDLPAHTRHRVAWTSPDEPTLWLAIHVAEESDGA